MYKMQARHYGTRESMRREILRRLVFATLLVTLPITCDADVVKNIARFYGKIDETNVKEFFTKYENSTVDVLEITSSGGLLLPAIDLANWVRRNKITVVVPMLCASACATIVFPAAWKKIIRSPGLVMWHGSAEQKDIRELQEKYVKIREDLLHGVYAANSDQAKYIYENKDRFEFIELQRSRQATFFHDIGVNEEICRLGQEPVKYETEWWTVTTDVMKMYGIDNVSAPENYGSDRYIAKNFVARIFLVGGLMTFESRNGIATPILVPKSKSLNNESTRNNFH
jgi:hypothetical protein